MQLRLLLRLSVKTVNVRWITPPTYVDRLNLNGPVSSPEGMNDRKEVL